MNNTYLPDDQVIAKVTFDCPICGDRDQEQEVTVFDRRQGYVQLSCSKTDDTWEYDLRDAFDQPLSGRDLHKEAIDMMPNYPDGFVGF